MLRYRLFLWVGRLMAWLPRRAAYPLGDLIGELAYLGNRPARRVALANMRHVLGPQAPAADLRAAARAGFRAAAVYYVDLARTPRMRPARFTADNVHVEGYEHLSEAVAVAHGVIIATLHYGNPEFVAQSLSARGLTFMALVEPIEPPPLFALFQRQRHSQGHRFVEANRGGVKQVIRHLRAGGLVAILVDRDIQHSGSILPFFGSPACLPTGAVDLALATGASILPTVTRRRRLDQFDVVIEPPLVLKRSGDAQLDRCQNSARLIARFEPYLEKEPGQWFVLEEPVWRDDRERLLPRSGR